MNVVVQVRFDIEAPGDLQWWAHKRADLQRAVEEGVLTLRDQVSQIEGVWARGRPIAYLQGAPTDEFDGMYQQREE